MISLLRRLGPYDDLRGWVRGVAVTFFAGLFLALSGAFGTDSAPIVPRLTYWMSVMAIGYVWGVIVSRFFFADGLDAPGTPWLKIVLASLTMSVPLTAMVWMATGLFFHSVGRLEDVPILFGAVLLVSLAMTTINVLIERGGRVVVTHATPASPRFLERLPLKLRGAEVWAVEAEDHYLRLHTSKGQDLILMRLVDAVTELEGIEGAQVHRSWWVARDAITDARRGDGRAVLTLKDGAEVPVSRTYAGGLRERGWI